MNGRNGIWSLYVFYTKQNFKKNLKYCQMFYLQNILIPIKFTQAKNSRQQTLLSRSRSLINYVRNKKNLKKKHIWHNNVFHYCPKCC